MDFLNFCKSGTISKGFLPQKRLILQFFRNFCEMGSVFFDPTFEDIMCDPYPSILVSKCHENPSMYAYRVGTYTYLDCFRSMTSKTS